MLGIELTFNCFYVDSKHIAMYSARAPAATGARGRPGLPDDRHRRVRLAGLPRAGGAPAGVDPPSGEIVNWNNKPAPAFRRGGRQLGLRRRSTASLLLERGLSRARSSTTDLVAAMNRPRPRTCGPWPCWPTLAAVLAGGAAPKPRAHRCWCCCRRGSARGGSRLDRELRREDRRPGRRDHGRRVAEARRRRALSRCSARSPTALAALIERRRSPGSST